MSILVNSNETYQYHSSCGAEALELGACCLPVYFFSISQSFPESPKTQIIGLLRPKYYDMNVFGP